MRKNIYDRSNRCIGFIVESSTQVQIFDKNAHLLGYYNKLNNTTLRNGSYFGKGDQTCRLLN